MTTTNLAQTETPEGWVLVPAQMTLDLRLALDDVNALRSEAGAWLAYYTELATMYTARADALQAWLERIGGEGSTGERLRERIKVYRLRAHDATERAGVMRSWIDEVGKAAVILASLTGEWMAIGKMNAP